MSEVKANRVEEIKRLHGEFIEACRAALPAAIKAGELLEAQFQEIREKKGSWEAWVKKNLKGVMCKATADNWRTLYKRRNDLLTVSNTSEAYRLIYRKPKAESQTPTSESTSDLEIKDAASPPEGSEVKLTFTKSQHREYEELVASLIEHVHKDPAAVILLALNYTLQNKDALKLKKRGKAA